MLQRLQELHLQHNSIEMIAEQALAGLTSLALLDLSRNNLHTMGPTSLQPLVSLQVLRITGETGVPTSPVSAPVRDLLDPDLGLCAPLQITRGAATALSSG